MPAPPPLTNDRRTPQHHWTTPPPVANPVAAVPARRQVNFGNIFGGSSAPHEGGNNAIQSFGQFASLFARPAANSGMTKSPMSTGSFSPFAGQGASRYSGYGNFGGGSRQMFGSQR